MLKLSNEVKINLLKLARKTIEEKLFKSSSIKVDLNFDVLNEYWGAFVTLHLDSDLRGCIGNIIGVHPLKETVKDMAEAAAFSDPRFSPLSKAEYESVELEITILSKPQEVSLDEVIPYEHGVVLSNGIKQSTYLPQVWSQLPDKEMFLSSLCQKGGMDRTCYLSDSIKIEIYEGTVFSEKEFNIYA